MIDLIFTVLIVVILLGIGITSIEQTKMVIQRPTLFIVSWFFITLLIVIGARDNFKNLDS